MKNKLILLGIMFILGLIFSTSVSAYYGWGIFPSYGAYAYNQPHYRSYLSQDKMLEYASNNDVLYFSNNARSDTYNFMNNNRNYYSTRFQENPRGYYWRNGGYDFDGYKGSYWFY